MPGWEFYQQNESGVGIPYPLWWACGLATTPASTGLTTTNLLGGNTIYAIPFNQQQEMSLTRIAINLKRQGRADATVRLGIYENLSNENNRPGRIVLDAGTLDVSPNAPNPPVCLRISGFNVTLRANTRY